MNVLRSHQIGEGMNVLDIMSAINEIATIGSKMISSDGAMILSLFKEPSLDGKSVNSLLLITTDNAYVNRALLGELDGFFYVGAELVLHGKDRDQSEA